MAVGSQDMGLLRKLAFMKRNGHLKISLDQLRRLENIKQGQITITEEEEAIPPRFLNQIKDIEVFVDEGEPAIFECRVEPKHDLNLSVRWYRDEEELVSDGRIKMSHDYGYASLHIFYTYPEDEGTYSCRATNELGEDVTKARLICRPLPHLRFSTPALEDLGKEALMQVIKDSAARYGVRAKLKGDEIFSPAEAQAPRFLLKMENFPKLLVGQSVATQTFLAPVGDPDMKIEWFLNEKPLLFKSSFSPAYDHGAISFLISKVYPDDFGELKVVAKNRFGEADCSCWIGEYPGGQVAEEEPDLPAWCNKVEKGRLAMECPPEITKHLVDLEVGETQTVKLEVHFIGNPRPEVIWTREGEELTNSRHVQIRERDSKSTLVLINIKASMSGEYRMVAVSPLGSDITVSRISVLPLDPDSLARLSRLEKAGLILLVESEERKLVMKQKKKDEKEERMRTIREKAKMNS